MLPLLIDHEINNSQNSPFNATRGEEMVFLFPLLVGSFSFCPNNGRTGSSGVLLCGQGSCPLHNRSCSVEPWASPGQNRRGDGGLHGNLGSGSQTRAGSLSVGVFSAQPDSLRHGSGRRRMISSATLLFCFCLLSHA